VDHFKAVNDTFGHAVGDRVLQGLAQVMSQEAPSSMVARMGGEEFLVMMPGLTMDQAFDHAERLRDACADSEVVTREGVVKVTVSAGIATAFPHTATVAELMEAADAALYRAKREGRDRTCVSATSGAPVQSQALTLAPSLARSLAS